MNRKELTATVLKLLMVALVVSLLCYGNIWYTLLMLPFLPLLIRRRKKKLADDRRWKLNLQFSDAIHALSAALEAGYSVENGIAEAYKDLRLSYSEDELIMSELKNIILRMRNNVPVEEAFAGLGARSGIEDIISFTDVFATAKRTGGNIIAIIRSTSEMIRTRVDFKRELQILIAAKKFEADIMKLVPLGILLYLRIFSPDMTAGLYGNPAGVIFMTVMLAVYILLCVLSDKIVEIVL